MREPKLKAMIEQGKWTFVFYRGVLAGGLFIPAFNALLEFLCDNEPFVETFFSGLRFSPFLGFAAGLIAWSSITHRYNKVHYRTPNGNRSSGQ